MPRRGSSAQQTESGKATTRLTRRGWALLVTAFACAVLAYGLGRIEMLYAACFIGLLPVSSLLLVRIRRLRLNVSRSFRPPVVAAGSQATVQVDVTNRSYSSSQSATWTDRIPWDPGFAGPGRLPTLAPRARGYTIRGSSTRLQYVLQPPWRGQYDIGPFQLEHGDPFGLAIGRASCEGVETLVVTPEVSELGESGQLPDTGDGTARLLQRNTAGNDDDLMTREYRRGDALRRVHWRASARHGELMVRQEEQRSFPEARLVIDTRRDGYRDVWNDFGMQEGASSRFEWALRMLASIGVKLHNAGFMVQVIETAPGQVAPLGDPTQGSGHDFEFLVSLAAVDLVPTGRAGAPSARENESEGRHGTVFAIVSEPSRETLRWVSSQKQPYERGVAFVVGRAPATIETLSAAGWTCVQADETDDPANVWADVSEYEAERALLSRGGSAQ